MRIFDYRNSLRPCESTCESTCESKGVKGWFHMFVMNKVWIRADHNRNGMMYDKKIDVLHAVMELSDGSVVLVDLNNFKFLSHISTEQDQA